MLAGAITAFATANETGITTLGVLAALVAGIALALLFALISLTLRANQTATGLALTIFGRGFSALVGAGYVGIPAPTLPKLHIPVLSDIPLLGPVVFGHDILVYFFLVILAVVAWAVRSTYLGLILRSVGDSLTRRMRLAVPWC
jgi:simple sugar transport system permease protein